MAEYVYHGQTVIQTGGPIKFEDGQPVMHRGWRVHIYEGATEQQAKQLAAADNKTFISWFDIDNGEPMYGWMEEERK